MKILLVEDDAMIGENVEIALMDEGIQVDWARTAAEAEHRLASAGYDAVLLDLGLPGKDGLDILRDLRAHGTTTPVLVITARDTVPERVRGLNGGADDYLVKPFDLDELIARLHAVVRRSHFGEGTVYRKDEVEVNLLTRQAMVGGHQVVLSAREWAILAALLARPGAILSRSQLEERLYGWAGEIESNAVEVYVHGLRKKLGHGLIVNVRGLGYMVERA
ncbi:response regulator [Oxalobacteraceae bacterium OM1]|nr:response regulator [Oxalobacteraceae bacterium OM1]